MNATHSKEIAYDRYSKDFALYLDGQLVGYAPTYQQGETRLDALVYELLRRGADELAYLASLVAVEKVEAKALATHEAVKAAAQDAPEDAETFVRQTAAIIASAEMYFAARAAREQAEAAELAYLASLVAVEPEVEALPFEPSEADLVAVEMTSEPISFAPTEADLAGVIAALIELDAESVADSQRSKAQGNGGAAKLHMQAAGRFRKAAAQLLTGKRYWHLATGILVESSSDGSTHRVSSQGDAYSPVGCTCPHGQEAKSGLCWHGALLIATERRMERRMERLELAA